MPKSKVRKKKKNRSRSTAPPPKIEKKDQGPSPTWYVAIMFALMAIGVVVIILNYIGLTPGETNNFWLVIGLGAIAGGFGMTLNFR